MRTSFDTAPHIKSGHIFCSRRRVDTFLVLRTHYGRGDDPAEVTYVNADGTIESTPNLAHPFERVPVLPPYEYGYTVISP